VTTSTAAVAVRELDDDRWVGRVGRERGIRRVGREWRRGCARRGCNRAFGHRDRPPGVGVGSGVVSLEPDQPLGRQSRLPGRSSKARGSRRLRLHTNGASAMPRSGVVGVPVDRSEPPRELRAVRLSGIAGRERVTASRERLRVAMHNDGLSGLPFPATGSLCGGAAWARWPSGSSKPVRCGNPTLGRFDSGAAPLSHFWRGHADCGRLERSRG